MSALDPELKHYAELDARMVQAVREIKVLTTMSWPVETQEAFLGAWSVGRIQLPEVSYPALDFSACKRTLEEVEALADESHPVGDYLARTARSWRYAAAMLEHLGKPEMGAFSIKLYGRPGDRIAGSEVRSNEAAAHFMGAARDVMADTRLADPAEAIDAETMKAQLEAEMAGLFTRHRIEVVIDPHLVAKAAAGPTRIRLRANTLFSEYDRLQLLNHEAYVHSLTAINGREQPYLKSLGRNSPRITATQEGLAVFAELVTGSMDIARLNRISLRIQAIEMALKGADFIQVFRFFLEQGQVEGEAFASAMRVFRGAPLSGGSAFTKDAVYLHGLLSVHTFFRYVFRTGRLALAQQLFAGKMTLHDVFTLSPLFDSGYLVAPLYLPPWAQRVHALAGYLSFSLFANRIRLDAIEEQDLRLGI